MQFFRVGPIHAVLLGLGFLLASTLTGQDNELVNPPGVPGVDLTKLIGVSGTTTAGQLRLALEVGPASIRTIRIYSEPSHTFLVALVDQNFRSSPQGEAWHSAYMRTLPLSSALGAPLAGAKPFFVVKARPAGDDRIDIWVNGDFPDGVNGERLVGSGYVGLKDFGFAGYVGSDGFEKNSAGVAVPSIIYSWVCFPNNENGCMRVSLGCKTSNFYCCSNAELHCCLAGCGFPPFNCCAY